MEVLMNWALDFHGMDLIHVTPLAERGGRITKELVFIEK